jgi:hypothetical protein
MMKGKLLAPTDTQCVSCHVPSPVIPYTQWTRGRQLPDPLTDGATDCTSDYLIGG